MLWICYKYSQNGEKPQQSLIRHTKRDLGLLAIERDHNYCRVPSWGFESRSRFPAWMENGVWMHGRLDSRRLGTCTCTLHLYVWMHGLIIQPRTLKLWRLWLFDVWALENLLGMPSISYSTFFKIMLVLTLISQQQSYWNFCTGVFENFHHNCKTIKLYKIHWTFSHLMQAFTGFYTELYSFWIK